MDVRNEELARLQSYVEGIDNQVTMILQSLQWDRKSLAQNSNMVMCKHDISHRIPADRKEIHEQECFLRQQGYSKDDKLLPDPFDPKAETLVKLNNDDIKLIIIEASKSDPLFNIGWGYHTTAPAQTLERLQEAYTADERCALHAAVVNAVPSCHDLADLALPSTNGGGQKSVTRSRQEILAELRDVRRRRAKYRVPAKTRHYSDVLRDVISSQMELLANPNRDDEPEVGSKHEVTVEKNTTMTNASSLSTEPKMNMKNENKTAKIDNSSVKTKTVEREESLKRPRYDRGDSRGRYSRDSSKEKSRRDSSKERPKGIPSRESSRERSKRKSRERSNRKSRRRHNEDYSREKNRKDFSRERLRRGSSREKLRKESCRERHKRESPGQRYHQDHDPNKRRYNRQHRNLEWENKSGQQKGRYSSRSERRNQWYNNKQNLRYDNRQDYRNRDSYRNDGGDSGNHRSYYSYPNDMYEYGKKLNHELERKSRVKKRRDYDSDRSRSNNRRYSRSRSSSSRSEKRKKKRHSPKKEIKKEPIDEKYGETIKIEKRSASHSSSSSTTHTKSTRSSWE